MKNSKELNAQQLLIVEVTEVAEEAAEVKEVAEEAAEVRDVAVSTVVENTVVESSVVVNVVNVVVVVKEAVVVVDAVRADLELLMMVNKDPRLHTSKEKKVHQLWNAQNVEATEKNSLVNLAKMHIPWIVMTELVVADAVIAKMVKEKAAGATTRSPKLKVKHQLKVSPKVSVNIGNANQGNLVKDVTTNQLKKLRNPSLSKRKRKVSLWTTFWPKSRLNPRVFSN